MRPPDGASQYIWPREWEETDQEIYGTIATDWTQSNFEKRQIFARLTVHGFHHKLCVNKRWHQACDLCICEINAKVSL